VAAAQFRPTTVRQARPMLGGTWVTPKRMLHGLPTCLWKELDGFQIRASSYHVCLKSRLKRRGCHLEWFSFFFEDPDDFVSSLGLYFIWVMPKHNQQKMDPCNFLRPSRILAWLGLARKLAFTGIAQVLKPLKTAGANRSPAPKSEKRSEASDAWKHWVWPEGAALGITDDCFR